MPPVGRSFRPGAIPIGKVILFLAALVPQALLIRGAITGDLGVNPAETIQLTTGRWALRFLLLSLAVTPVRRLTGWNPIIRFRRMLGLFAFFYAVCHFAAYWSFDLNFAFGAMIGDVLKRPFIALGFAAFLLMVPLAVTSTKGWIRRMGKRWTQLHRLVYLSAILAVVHFALKVKVFTGDPVIYAGLLAALLLVRIVWALRAGAKSS
jgi:methionine sulfoxide reductase heme-binding subunit